MKTLKSIYKKTGTNQYFIEQAMKEGYELADVRKYIKECRGNWHA